MGGKSSRQKKEKDNLVELEVLRAYDLNVKKIKPIRNGFKIKTKRGSKFLKQATGSEADLNFIFNVLEQLARQGFYKIARFLPTKYGDPYVRMGDNFYYLTDWIEGKECNLKKPLVLEESVRTLAQLHKASLNMPAPPLKRSRLGQWPEIYNQTLVELQEFKIMALEKMFPTEFDRLLLNKVDYFYHQGQGAMETLANSRYQELVEAEEQKGVLCHRDFIGRNLIRAKDGEIYLIDFDHCGFDLAMYDLSRFLNKHLPKHGWDQEVARFALNTYNSVRKISKDEYQVLRALLEMPRKFHRLANQYYQHKRDWAEEDFIRKLKGILKREQVRSEFLSTFSWSY